ncbi:MAG: hypothetical protein F6K11_30455 [Leptolyngbya sp. SIO3F4]|nr:hypothetical protein [Leptolyngbya sp. SIO3F4]
MISPLFAQFRHQYASGALTTELLMPHAEQYLVKATVTIGEQVVATALAADKSLSVADDQAKIRVLAMLGFGPESNEKAPTDLPISQAVVDTPAIDTNIVASISTPDQISTSSSPIPEETLPSPIQNLEPEVEDSEDIGRPLDSITPDEAPAPSEVPASSIAATAIENFDDTNPVDLSDVIAQTDVEMARLGWSSIQGRTYLEKTFNKRSRQQLTDEELLTFLLYLESQPTPSMG